jgi:Amt family ammonium transporter
MLPHNVPFTLMGAGVLWFGWFGFNAGSALAANGIAGLAFAATFLAPSATLVVWTFLDYIRSGKPTAVGAATAIVVGLVAITPAAGFVGPMNAIWLGGLAAIPSYLMLQWRAKTNFDDSLDVLAAHGVGGTVGALLTGVFAQKSFNGVADGLLYGNPGQLGTQALAVAAALIYSFAVSFVLVKLVGLVIPLRPSADDEIELVIDERIHERKRVVVVFERNFAQRGRGNGLAAVCGDERRHFRTTPRFEHENPSAVEGGGGRGHEED